MSEARGPVTFLMTDIERSSGHWERSEAEMAAWLEEHDAIIRTTVEDLGGRLFKHTGDGAAAEFAVPTSAVVAALQIQQKLTDRPLRVRIGVHTGVAQQRDGDHFGLSVTRCARLMGLAHGGQILVSAATADLVADVPMAGVELIDLGTHSLRGLERPERVFQLVAPDIETSFAPLRSEAPEHNLPAPRTELVGRKREIDQVHELVMGHRLVTLTGIGGCGKTRLATEAALALLDTFPGGIFFVDLSATGDEAHVAPDVAAALQLGLGAGTLGVRGVDPLHEIIAFLADRRALVVLDNCEHLIDAAAELVDTLLSRCHRLRVLATSREALEIEGEHSYRVPSLQIPEPGATGGESVELFVTRAAAVRSGFVLDPGNEHAVAEICRRLDGIPLAIELAASQVGHLDVADLLARLDDRFQLLVGGRRRAQRQQTLQAAIDWSYDLLTEDEQSLLRRLSVFSGGFTLPAVEGALGRDVPGVVRVLASLVSKSLVVVDEVSHRTRYRLLESIRLYAADRLVDADEATSTRDAHRDWFLSVAESRVFDAALLGLHVAADLTLDFDNHRAALEWSRSQGATEKLARHFAQLAGVWWSMGFHEEGEAWFQTVTPSVGGLEGSLAARVFVAGAVVAMAIADDRRGSTGRGDGTVERALRAMEIGGDDHLYAVLWTVMPRMLDHPDEARADLDRFLRWPRRAEFPGHERMARDLAGVFCWVDRDLDAAARHFEDLVRGADLEDVYFAEAGAALDLFVTRLMQHREDDFGVPLHAMRRLDAKFAALGLSASAPKSFTLLLAETYAHAIEAEADAAIEFVLALVDLVRRRRIPLAIGDCAVAFGALAYHRGEIEVAYGLVSSATPAGPRRRFVTRMPAGYSLLLHYQRRIARAVQREGLDVSQRPILDPEDAIDAELVRLGVSV